MQTVSPARAPAQPSAVAQLPVVWQDPSKVEGRVKYLEDSVDAVVASYNAMRDWILAHHAQCPLHRGQPGPMLDPVPEYVLTDLERMKAKRAAQEASAAASPAAGPSNTTHTTPDSPPKTSPVAAPPHGPEVPVAPAEQVMETEGEAREEVDRHAREEQDRLAREEEDTRARELEATRVRVEAAQAEARPAQDVDMEPELLGAAAAQASDVEMAAEVIPAVSTDPGVAGKAPEAEVTEAELREAQVMEAQVTAAVHVPPADVEMTVDEAPDAVAESPRSLQFEDLISPPTSSIASTPVKHRKA